MASSTGIDAGGLLAQRHPGTRTPGSRTDSELAAAKRHVFMSVMSKGLESHQRLGGIPTRKERPVGALILRVTCLAAPVAYGQELVACEAAETDAHAQRGKRAPCLLAKQGAPVFSRRDGQDFHQRRGSTFSTSVSAGISRAGL